MVFFDTKIGIFDFYAVKHVFGKNQQPIFSVFLTLKRVAEFYQHVYDMTFIDSFTKETTIKLSWLFYI